MNRQGLIDAVCSDTETSKGTVTRVIDALLAQIASTVVAGGKVKLTGFGTFEPVPVAERVARNLQSGGPIAIAASQRPRFTPSRRFKDQVRDAFLQVK